MPQLYFIRHGEAQESADDASRSLTLQGREQAIAAARAINILCGVPDIILSSPILRARQTAEIIQEIFSESNIIFTEYLTTSTGNHQLIEQLNLLKKDRILLVGHEPHISSLIAELISGEKKLRIDIKKGSLAVLSVSMPIVIGHAVLDMLFNPWSMKVFQ